MLKARVPLLLDLPDEAWFDVALLHKDIGLRSRRLGRWRCRSLGRVADRC